MSDTSCETGGESVQAALFGDSAPAVAAPSPDHRAVGGAPRVLIPERNQVELRACDLDSLLATDHPARTVWAFVNALDLAPLYAQIRSAGSRAGAPAIDPTILVALWLWATVDGVGSAREIDRLCERDDVYRWICGGVNVNYHTLSDFRTKHDGWLDTQLTRSIASLLQRRLIKLDVVAQDGLRVRASAKAASFRRRDRLQQLHALAKAQVQALKSELEQDACASSRRKQSARERMAREREQRLAQALATMEKISVEKQSKGSKRTRKRKDGDDGDGPAPSNRIIPKPVQTNELRVSTTDPEARVTKMADGGWRPGLNVQVAVDAETHLIAGIDVVSGTDMKHMSPMHQQVQRRYGITPSHWLADGGFGQFRGIDDLYERGTQPIVPPYQRRSAEVDPLSSTNRDRTYTAHWRKIMTTDWAKDLYLQRAASVECVNAHLRGRGLTKFYVRGLIKARAVALWHALAHNLMRLRSLGIAPA
jgi:transposase